MSSDDETDDQDGKETLSMSCCDACPHCTMSFSSNLYLQRHIRKMHSEIVALNPENNSLKNRPIGLSCTICQKIFINKSLLGKHVRKSHSDTGGVEYGKISLTRRYNTVPQKTCPICSKTFRLSLCLKKHIESVHVKDDTQNIETVDQQIDVANKDEIVDKKTEDFEELLSCNSLSAISCATCSKTFTSKSALQKHTVKSHNILLDDAAQRMTPISEKLDMSPSRICSICKKAFSSTYYVRKHIETAHKDVKQDKAGSLMTNVRSVENLATLKTHPCLTCDKIYSSNSALQNHVKKLHSDSSYVNSTKKPRHSKLPLKICSRCLESFRSITLLRKHIVSVHEDNCADTAVRIKTVKNSSLSSFVYSCEICPRKFSRKDVFERHVNNKHSNGAGTTNDKSGLKQEDSQRLREKEFVARIFCELCSKGFRLKSNLRKHIICVHTDVNVDTVCPVKNLKSKITCPVCFIKLCDIDGLWSTKKRVTINDLMTHLNEAHDEKLSFDRLTFDDETKFSRWLTGVQVDTPCSFQKQSGSDPLKNCVYYYCSRSGSRYDQHVGERKRRLKVQGIAKVGYTCPSHLVLYRTSGEHRVEVKYLAKHYCHANAHEQLGHIRINQSDRNWLAEKVSTEVPMDVVLRDILNEADGTLKRNHVVTKTDVTNIERSLRLNRAEFIDRNDLSKVLGSYDDDGGEYSPIILYKRQGTRSVDIHPDVLVGEWEEDDFLFGMMNATQCQMLVAYGSGESSVVCVDSTHTTNPKQTCFGTSLKRTRDFHLSTLMVLDSGRQGFPVAFLYSNRQSETTFALFLHAVRRRSGVVSCETFMSDMTPQFYNAWSAVMGDCPSRRFYSWHVDKSFRDHTRRLIRDNDELPVIVYRQLRAAMIEQDAFTFEQSLPALVQQLLENPSTVAFGKFFESHYVNCVESWASCYRAQLGAHTDMHLERMHDIFKHVYEQGKRHKRLDGAIASLLHLVFDKDFNNLSGMRTTNAKKLSEIRARHEESLRMIHAITTEVIAGSEWIVVADNEVFTVRRVRDERCACELRCAECRACVDTYVCSCADSATYFNMCKHIHLIGTVFPLFYDDSALEINEQSHEHDDTEFKNSGGLDDNFSMTKEKNDCDDSGESMSREMSNDIGVNTANLAQSQVIVKELCNEVAHLVEFVTDDAQMRQIIESLRAAKPKQEDLGVVTETLA